MIDGLRLRLARWLLPRQYTVVYGAELSAALKLLRRGVGGARGRRAGHQIARAIRKGQK